MSSALITRIFDQYVLFSLPKNTFSMDRLRNPVFTNGAVPAGIARPSAPEEAEEGVESDVSSEGSALIPLQDHVNLNGNLFEARHRHSTCVQDRILYEDVRTKTNPLHASSADDYRDNIPQIYRAEGPHSIIDFISTVELFAFLDSWDS